MTSPGWESARSTIGKMWKALRIVLFYIPLSALLCILFHRTLDYFLRTPPMLQRTPNAEDVMGSGTAIFFLETSGRLKLSPITSCAVESAARVNPRRPVVLFMESLRNLTSEEINTSHKSISPFYAMDNVFLHPLDMESFLQDTPLYPWYITIRSSKEKHWLTVNSDANRLALMWKYGGVYMDADFISIKPIPDENFLAAQASRFTSNRIFSFNRHNDFILSVMENFAQNFNASTWVKAGPGLFTRMTKRLCGRHMFEEMSDVNCRQISLLHPNRFFSIGFHSWRKYYMVWESNPFFSNSYALFLWSHLNTEGISIVPGSETLVEHLFQTYCPTTYEFLIQNS